MLKKLKRVIIDFNLSKYFQSVGLKKSKLTKEEETPDYEYYDEEDPDTTSKISKVSKKKLTERAAAAMPENHINSAPFIDLEKEQDKLAHMYIKKEEEHKQSQQQLIHQ